MSVGISDFCLCTGARNSALIDCLDQVDDINTYFFYDERCAAFFALGRARASGRPTAVITTSGTAVGELLPAVMESYYSAAPLIVISADRPRNFRGTGAPQAAEQVGIFGVYTPFIRDIQFGESPSLNEWQQTRPGQLNVCLEEAYTHSFQDLPDFPPVQPNKVGVDPTYTFDRAPISQFFEHSKFPIAIVSTLNRNDRREVINYLQSANIPVYCEGPSGIRDSDAIKQQRIMSLDKFWERSKRCGYPVDGILRIGGVPTTRLWRDLEKKKGQVNVCSISHLPFSGLSWGEVLHTDISRYLKMCDNRVDYPQELINEDKEKYRELQRLLDVYRRSEPSLFRQLSEIIPEKALVYLGNSLPIREWDLSATFEEKHLVIEASRGLNGIDGQISTFLGLATSERSNWAIVGDLTALYDLSAPWIIDQLGTKNIQIVVINNGGGKIFSRMFSNDKLQNNHQYRLKAMADLWGLEYQLCHEDIQLVNTHLPQIVECIPNAKETQNFWNEYT